MLLKNINKHALTIRNTKRNWISYFSFLYEDVMWRGGKGWGVQVESERDWKREGERERERMKRERMKRKDKESVKNFC